MTEPKPINAEEVIATALIVPMNLVAGLADLLIEKGVISQRELIVLLQHQIDASRRDEEGWVTTILENLLVQFQNRWPS